MNHSKTRDPRFLRKWYLSGAIKQPLLPTTGVEIDAIGRHYAGPAAGFLTLSLALPADRAGNEPYSPVVYVIVPPSKRFSLGAHLDRLPGNSMPMELFFPETRKRIEELSFPEEAPPKKVEFRHGIDAGKYTVIEKEGGWSKGEVSFFVSHQVECELLPALPNRLVLSTIVDRDEIESIIRHSNFTSRHVTYQDRWK